MDENKKRKRCIWNSEEEKKKNIVETAAAAIRKLHEKIVLRRSGLK